MEIILIQYQPTIALGLLKGKMGGTVFQQGNNTAIIRLKGYRKGKPSSVRSLHTQQLAFLSTTWRTIGAAAQASWKPASLLWPFTNKFGVTYFASPYQVFVAYNLNLLKIQFTIDENPNAPFTPVNPGPVIISSLTTSDIQLSWTNAGSTDDFVAVYASLSMSPGRNTNNAKLAYIASYGYDGSTAINIDAEYFARFPTLQSNQQLILKTVFFNRAYPFLYYPSIVSGIIA